MLEAAEIPCMKMALMSKTLSWTTFTFLQVSISLSIALVLALLLAWLGN